VAVRFRLLGSVEALVGDRWVVVTAPKQRALLALLALGAGHPVSAGRLVDELWPADPPAGAGKLVQAYVLRLRRLLGDPDGRLLVTRRPGYLLATRPDQVDARVFADLVEQGRRAVAAGDAGAVHLLASALAIWRGDLLGGDLPGGDHRGGAAGHSLAAEAARLAELRLDAVQARIAAELPTDPARVAGELELLLAEHPLREGLWELLMLALYRAGRQADALAAYQRVRQLVSSELGIEPDPRLRDLHQRILLADPVLQATGAARPEQPVPASADGPVTGLPRLARHFLGRDEELRRLCALLDASPPVEGLASPVCAVDGMAGVGKTELALHAGRLLAGTLRDGTVFLDLLGYTPDAQPLAPAEALDRLLRLLGVPPERVPADAADRAALYQATVAGRELLLILDNARTGAQVRPLLPAVPGCRVVITSRRRLTALDDVPYLSLDALGGEPAAELFSRIAGVAAGEGPVPRVVARCGRLPLALRIVAARYRDGAFGSLAELDRLLADEHERLALLDDGERSISAAFAVSYASLGTAERRLFRLLGLLPGTDADPYDAAALAGTGLPGARTLLARLADSALLARPAGSRYAFHDLLRAYAADRAERDETEADRRAALIRLLDHYAHAAAGAMDAGYPAERDLRPAVAQPAGPRPPLPDAASARDWLDAQHDNVIAAAGYAAEHGLPGYAVTLSQLLGRHLRTRARYQDLRALQENALRAARELADGAGEVRALVGLGDVTRILGRHDEAVDWQRQALELARERGDRRGERAALSGLGEVHWIVGRHDLALEYLERARALAASIGDHSGEAYALGTLGEVYRMVGRLEPALDHYERALRRLRELGDRIGETSALIGLAEVHRVAGRYPAALDHHRAALALARQTGHRQGEAYALVGLGNTHRQAGEPAPALAHLAAALAVIRDIHDWAGQTYVLASLGETYRQLGRHREALEHHGEALARSQDNGDRNNECEALLGLAETLRETGDPVAALTRYDAALRIAGELGQRLDEARAHQGAAQAYRDLNRSAEADQHARRAGDIYRAAGLPDTVVSTVD